MPRAPRQPMYRFLPPALNAKAEPFELDSRGVASVLHNAVRYRLILVPITYLDLQVRAKIPTRGIGSSCCDPVRCPVRLVRSLRRTRCRTRRNPGLSLQCSSGVGHRLSIRTAGVQRIPSREYPHLQSMFLKAQFGVSAMAELHGFVARSLQGVQDLELFQGSMFRWRLWLYHSDSPSCAHPRKQV